MAKLFKARELDKEVKKELTLVSEDKYKLSIMRCFKQYSSSEFLLPFNYAETKFPPSLISEIKGGGGKNGKFKEIPFKGELRENQKLWVKEIIAILNRSFSVLISLYTGAGKTVIALYLISKIKDKTLIVTHSRPIFKQWVHKIKEVYPGIKVKTVESIEDLKGEEGEGEDEPDVYITMESKLPWFSNKGIKLLIIDEAHCFYTENRYHNLLSITPDYIIALTATYKRKDNMHMCLFKMIGEKNIFEVKNPNKFNFYRIKSHVFLEESFTVQGTIDYGKLCNDSCENEDLNECIIDLVKNGCEKGKKFIILTKRTEHCERLTKNLTSIGIENDIMYKSKNKFVDSQVLVGTMNKLSVGFDQENSCGDSFSGKNFDSLILFNTIKDENAFAQSIGRVMRSSDHISEIYWLEPKNDIFKKHFYSVNKLLKTLNCNLIELSTSETRKTLKQKNMRELED